MKITASQESKNIFEGAFKVPFSKKTSPISSPIIGRSSRLRVPTPKYIEANTRYSNIIYQKLIGKLIQNSNNMTKYEMKVLSTHPIIKNLLKTSKNSSASNSSFYVPIDSLLNPELYSNSHVPIIVETHSPESNAEKQNLMDDFRDEKMEKVNSEKIQEKKIGKYTKKERQHKILKYKQKLQRYRNGNTIRQAKQKRKYNRILSKDQPRKNGRFASHPDITESILQMINNGPDTSSSCSTEYLCMESESDTRDLNDIVSEITRIF